MVQHNQQYLDDKVSNLNFSLSLFTNLSGATIKISPYSLAC